MRAVGLLVLASVLLVGCAASDEEQAAEAVAENLTSDGTFPYTNDDADCVGKGFVDALGVDGLEDYGLITRDLSAPETPVDVRMTDDDAADVARVVVDCVDAVALVKAAALSDRPNDPALERCLDEVVTEDAFEAFMIAVFTSDQDAADRALFTPVDRCRRD